MRLDVSKYKEMKIKALKESVSKMKTRPVLAAIVADGYSEASARYVRNKHKLAEEIGIEVIETRIKQEEYSNEWLEAYINVLNNSERVNGIIVQLPFFDVDVDYISSLISPEKDVDGFNPVNLGKLIRGEDCLVSCTPQGIMGLLEYQGIALKGKDVCIVGKSNIVGKPLANMMINKGATVTVCNSNTKNLIRNVYNADIGIVRKIDDEKMVVQIDEEMIVYEKNKLGQLLLSYCITTHKSQGSQADYVINLSLPMHSRMLSSNLLYVADTRSKATMVEIGDMATIQEAIKIHDQIDRNTFLQDLFVADK